jgi:hypothetical protein
MRLPGAYRALSRTRMQKDRHGHGWPVSWWLSDHRTGVAGPSTAGGIGPDQGVRSTRCLT